MLTSFFVGNWKYGLRFLSSIILNPPLDKGSDAEKFWISRMGLFS